MGLCGWPGASSLWCCVQESETESALIISPVRKITCGLLGTLFISEGKNRICSFSRRCSSAETQPFMEPGGWQTPLAVLVMSSPFFLPPWLFPMISSYLSLHLNPPHPPWFPFSSHSLLLSPFPRVPGPSCDTTPSPQWLMPSALSAEAQTLLDILVAT